MGNSLLGRLKRLSDKRPGFPGERWLTFGAGLWLLTRRSASPLGRVATLAAGAALVWRAASGRDGLARLLLSRRMRRLADRSGTPRSPERFIDVAAPWPYATRVRVSAISQAITGRSLSTP